MKPDKYAFSELINIKKIKELMISYYNLTGLSWALIDLNGNIMTSPDGNPIAAGFDYPCLNVHHGDSKILKKYVKNAAELYKEFSNQKYVDDELMVMAVPIYIDKEHMASILMGHVFLKKPDIETFRKQALDSGFDEAKYLDLLSKIPLHSQDHIHKCLDLLNSLVNVIEELGLEKKKLLDSKNVLKESEKRHVFALEAVQLGTWKYDFTKKLLHLDKKARSHLNSPSNKIELGEILAHIHPDDSKLFIKSVKEAINPANSKKTFKKEFRIVNNDDSIRWLTIEGNIIFKDEIPHIAYGTTQDITKPKKAEETLQFQLNILKNVRHCIIVYDLQGKIIYWNDSAESVYGYSEEEMLGKNIDILYLDHEKQLLKPDIQEIIDLGEYIGEWEGKRKDGTTVIVDIRETVLYDANNKIIGIIGVSKDITQRKIAEKKIKESLEEKEVLLKEIHHRVKNNLQIIYSLLNLQTEYVEGEESLNVLKESQNRVKSMAMVHERLYQSPNLKDINFKEYIENLITDLCYSYGIERGTIKIHFNLEDLKIDIDTAIPCGLIINELVTNSLKYAFPQGKGTLKVELVQVSDYIKLVVADNGIGLPTDIDLENTETLGLKMVNNLIYQLDGTLELNRTHGTEFIIKFRKLEYKNRI